VNYLYGLPDWAVSIAAEAGGRVVAGVVCVPPRDALFLAAVGVGAWRSSLADIIRRASVSGHWPDPDESGEAVLPGSQPLSCTSDVPLSRALIATGFGYERDRRLVQGQVLSAVLPRVRDIRRNGACSVDLCSVAAGNVDGYYERGVQYWDIAAGKLVSGGAGGVVGGGGLDAVGGGLLGGRVGQAMTIRAAPAFFSDWQDLLLTLDAERAS